MGDMGERRYRGGRWEIWDREDLGEGRGDLG